MAQISAEQLNKLKALYQQIFGIELSDKEALEEGMNLVRMVELTHREITDEDIQHISKRDSMQSPF